MLIEAGYKFNILLNKKKIKIITLKRLILKTLITIKIKIANLCFICFTFFYIGTQVLK